MERFAFKIDKVLKANLYKICRLCGIDNPDKVPIVQSSNCDTEANVIDADAEPELSQKIKDLIGFTVYKDDKMPQFVCTLCVDKINDFYEFREMCFSTDQQTRKLLGIKPLPKKNSHIKLEVKTEPVDKRGKKRKLEDLDNKKEIKEEVEKINSDVLSHKKKQRFPDESGKNNSQFLSISKKKKIQALGEVDRSSTSHSLAINKKKIRLTEVPDKANSDTIPLSKKQMRLQVLKQKVQIQPLIEDAVKTEIKDEPAMAEAGLSIENFQKLKHLCIICNQRFVTKNKLERHRITEHNPNIAKFFCSTCNEEVVKSNDIKSHQLWHKLSKTPYTCGLCNESLLTINLFTRHLSNHTQNLLTPILIFDRECSLCHETFVTNFLYNTHPCALRSKKCGGCNRKMKTEAEYQLHAATCDKAYLVASKHVGGGIEAIRIKNENDVEAAVENFSRNIGVPLTMMPVVSLTRLSIEPNQKVNVASTSAAAALTVPKSKKNSKKGISKRDLKRVDDLLKSTMDTLVSIKHEPEISVDAEPHSSTPQPDTQQLQSTNNDDEFMELGNNTDDDDNDGMQFDDDDFQNRDYDNSDQESSYLAPHVQTHAGNDFVVKQEPRDGFQPEERQHTTEINTVKIKTEIPDNVHETHATAVAPSPSKVPVLKLKITKEHGTLNSSLVNDNKERSEKKKKKKKRKDAEKTAAEVSNNYQVNAANSPNDSSDKVHNEPSMPLPGIVHIKQEHIDDEYFEGNTTKQPLNKQPEATIMTSIPIMQFQIACVSSGVEFDKGDVNKEAEVAGTIEQATQETELQDVKPNREELDRLLAENTTNTTEALSVADDERQTDLILSQEEECSTKQHRQVLKTPRKSVATKSTSQRKINSAKAKSPIEKIPKIVAVSSGINLPNADNEHDHHINEKEKELNTSTDELMAQVRIKTEPRDDDYYNEQNLGATVHHMDYDEDESGISGADQPLPSEEPSLDIPINNSLNNEAKNDEQAYINSIDFNNIKIKQEKDIDVSESQLITQHFPQVSDFNGSVLTNNDDECSGSAAVEDEVVEDEEEEEDDDEEDYDEYNETPAEEEVREYREIDWPPLLSEGANDTPKTPTDAKVDKPLFGLMIANVCSQAADDFAIDNAECKETTASSADKVGANITEHVTNALEKTLQQTAKSGAEINNDIAEISKVNKNMLTDTNSMNMGGNAAIEALPKKLTPLDDIASGSIIGQTVENAESLLEMTEKETVLADTEVHADIDITASIDEERQNILNHEMCNSFTNNVTLNIPNEDDQTPTNSLPSIEISNATSTQLESYLEDISSNSCSIFSSIGNENSTNVVDTRAPSAANLETAPVEANHEETENLYNENIDATINLQQQHAMPLSPHSHVTPPSVITPQQLQPHQQLELLIDNSNVNEIAENNNNANIERELLDDVNHHNNEENVNELSAQNESLPPPSSHPSPTT